MNSEMISILAPAFCAGVLISLTHVVLGQEVLKRGIIFLDLAVAQCAALGMMSFKLLTFIDPYSFIGQYGVIGAGLCAALICAFLFKALEKAQHFQEALIGCTFVLAASLSIMLTANAPHGAEDIKNILAGQILWTTWHDVWLCAPVFITLFLTWQFLPFFRTTLFYPLFAIAIPFAVNIMGVYLVFASLIFPALAVAQNAQHKTRDALLISLLSYGLGLWASSAFDWPSGPAIVLAMAMLSAGYYLMSKNSGIKLFRRSK